MIIGERMPNSWKYAQVLQFPQSDLCECGHPASHHNNRRGFCYDCMMGGGEKPADIADEPPDDVYATIFRGPRSLLRDGCEHFRRWSPKRVKAFWKVVNIGIALKYDLEQTMLDDFSPNPDNWGMWTRGYWVYRPIPNTLQP